MKLTARLAMFLTLIVVSACGGGVGGGSNLAGTYNGEFVVANSSPFVGEKVTLTIDGAGRVTGTTTGGASSGTPGGSGTLTGTITGAATNLTSDLTFTSTTLGTYTAKGSGGVYNEAGKEMAISVNASKNGSFVGSFIMVVKQ